MSSNVCILDNGPACEPDKLIVEIIGKQHPDTQKLLICDAEGQPIEAITAAAEEEEISGEGVSSLLKIWDWEEQQGESLYLEIASESGTPIRLPLLSDLRATPRQDEAQLNQIVPVVPCTALPSIKQQDDSGIPVLVRSGYIYVFVWGKLWRELEVRFTDEGTRYFDIDVASFRNEHGFANGKRTATGVALEDIWLPSQWNGRWAGSLDIMFSEIQLSAARLTRYERHENYRNPRVSMPSLLVSESSWQQRWSDAPAGLTLLEAQHGGQHNHRISPVETRYRMASNVFPVSLCAPQRQRQPGHEWLLDQPTRMLCDLTGAYPEQAFERTRQTTEAWRTGIASDPPADFESEAWRTCYHGCDADAINVWQAQDAQTDTLQAVRDRQLYAVLLPDPMYRLRHLHARIDGLQTLLKYCTQLAMEHPHHSSALLLHNLAVPTRISGNRNPLSQSLQNKLNEDGKREINIATAAVERANVWKLLESVQLALTDGLNSQQFQQCLADHLSLDHFDYHGAMFFAVRLIASIASSPAQLDPLALKGDIHDAVSGYHLHRPGRNPGQQLLTDITNRDSHPLHVMLLPEIRVNALFEPYRQPTDEEPNLGDGRFRATLLASLEDKDEPDEKSETLDGITLAALMENGTLQDSFTAHQSFKAGMAVLAKINEILNSSIKAAESRVAERSNQLDSSNQRVAETRAGLSQSLQDKSHRQTELAQHARAVDIRLHGMYVEHLRQTMPKAFEGALFVRSGKFKSSEYYLLGLEDLPEVDANAASEKMFGQYLDGAGNRLATTDRRSARGAGMPVVPETGIYLAVPRNSDTARILSELNKVIHSEALAGSALLASRARAEQARASLQHAVENLRRSREGSGHRALNSKPFSAMVLMMELWNVQVAMGEFEKVGLERGVLRQGVGIMSTFADLLIAIEALSSKMLGNQFILSVTAERTVFRVSSDLTSKLLGPRLAKHIVSAVTVRILGQVTAGLLLAGLSLSDAIDAARWNDNSAWGHGMIAAGSLLAAGATLAAGSALFGPLGWAALALIVGGVAVVAFFSNTSFEDWLAGSVFTGIDADSVSQHYLRDPDHAFYRLGGLLAGIRIQIDSNPDFNPLALADRNGSITSFKQQADTCITVQSNIKGMAAQLGSPSLDVRCQLMRAENRFGHGGLGLGQRSTLRPLPSMSHPVLQYISGDKFVVYVNTPADTRQSHPFQDFDEHHWEVRAQFRLKDQRLNKTWVFPAPEPKVAPVNPDHYIEPNFMKTNQLLWADQNIHAGPGDTSS